MEGSYDIHRATESSTNWDRVLILVAVVLVIAGVLGYFTNWFGVASPRFTNNVNYKFEYTIKTTHPVGSLIIPGRGFVVDDQTVFSTPTVGVRDERFLVEDITLPPNTFRLLERETPAIVIGERTFQEATKYTEVRYHQVMEEPQTVIPNLKPRQR